MSTSTALREAIHRLWLRFRMGSPQFVRMSYRLAKSLQTAPASKEFTQEIVNDCRVFASRYNMLDYLPSGGRVAELGTYKGDFAIEILKRANPVELHLVDIDYSRLNEALRAEPRVTLHEGFTHKVIAAFPDEFFDWIYVDADHSYEATLRDAEASAAKVKAGGYLVFNDFAHTGLELDRYGVHRAVVDFALERRWQVKCFAFNPGALYDVALQKPV